jgi:hypothetical protein
MSHNNAYNKTLHPASALRTDSTKAEACLWKYVLRGRGEVRIQLEHWIEEYEPE